MIVRYNSVVPLVYLITQTSDSFLTSIWVDESKIIERLPNDVNQREKRRNICRTNNFYLKKKLCHDERIRFFLLRLGNLKSNQLFIQHPLNLTTFFAYWKKKMLVKCRARYSNELFFHWRSISSWKLSSVHRRIFLMHRTSSISSR